MNIAPILRKAIGKIRSRRIKGATDYYVKGRGNERKTKTVLGQE